MSAICAVKAQSFAEWNKLREAQIFAYIACGSLVSNYLVCVSSMVTLSRRLKEIARSFVDNVNDKYFIFIRVFCLSFARTTNLDG